MKHYKALVLLLLAVTGIGTWIFMQQSATAPSSSLPKATNAVPHLSPPLPAVSLSGPDSPVTPPSKAEEFPEEEWNRLQRMHKMSLTLNGPIAFYARVLDQHGQPVHGAELTLSISRYSASGLSRLREAWRGKLGPEPLREMLVITSTPAGGASVSGKSGTALRVERVEREGYLWPELGYGSFSYEPQNSPLGRPHADPANPMLIRLWKRGDSAPWFGFSCVFSRSEQETDRFRINLFEMDTRKPPEHVDLLLEVAAIDTKPNNMGWLMEYKLSAPAGGIQETTEPIPYLAPTDGYLPSWVLRARKQAVTDGQPKAFYLKTRNGQVFANFKLIVKGGYLKIEGRVNPRGSRILEPDPAKVIGDPDEISRLDELTAKK